MVEYVVNVLKVMYLVIVGYIYCGGVVGCYVMCLGYVFEFEEKISFVGCWMDILCFGYEWVLELFEGE